MTSTNPDPRPFQLLLVEDNPADVLLTREALAAEAPRLVMHVARDGVEALAFLRREGRHADAPRPNLVLLDLNLPRKDGRGVLREMKQDDRLKTIPVVVLSTSSSDEDVQQSYVLSANAFMTKPLGFRAFEAALQALQRFWLSAASLPRETE